MQWGYRFVSGVLFWHLLPGWHLLCILSMDRAESLPIVCVSTNRINRTGDYLLIALLHNPKSNAMKRGYAFLGSLSILWSVGVAARHVWLQNLPPDRVPSCGPGLDYWLETLPMKSVLQQVLNGSGECAAIDWTFLGQSLPVWSLVFFSILLLISLWQLFRKYQTAPVKRLRDKY